MIIESEVREIISNEFPELKIENSAQARSSIYTTMQCFADFTKDVVQEGDISKVKTCFKIAEKMLDDGNNIVKNAIENVYVYSIGTFVYTIETIFILSPANCIQLKELFNGSLRKEYYKQVTAGGI
ncbi:MAG TPA: hypothetical protein VNY73_10395 [Bacteroidia bacterium]|jgi:hypothetical protein|nr:hypothetical protein [Bacteroidia bacterium]